MEKDSALQKGNKRMEQRISQAQKETANQRRNPMAGQAALTASFTIEAAILVPLILILFFWFIQMILYLHDTIWVETWLYEESGQIRWEQEGGERREGKIEGEANGIFDFYGKVVSRLPVLRVMNQEETYHSGGFRLEAYFQVRLLPTIITQIFEGTPDTSMKQSTEKITDSPGFLKIVGAILQEKEQD